jgi:dienelactone hydrolase
MRCCNPVISGSTGFQRHCNSSPGESFEHAASFDGYSQGLAELPDHPAALLAYPEAGHAVFGPPVAPGDAFYPDLDASGGTAEANDAARAAAWPRALAFLRAAFAAPSH